MLIPWLALTMISAGSLYIGFVIGGAYQRAKLAARPKLPHKPDVWNDYQGELVRRRAAQREGREVLRVVLAGKRREGR